MDNLLRSGKIPSDITHIIFSHLHSDHMMDYARLVHAAWDEGGAPIKVFGPAPIARMTQQYFGPDGVFSQDLRARTELKPSQEVWLARGGTLPRLWPAPEVTEISGCDVIDGNGWRIPSTVVPHAQPILHCMGFAVEAVGKKFVYSGDAGICPPLEALCQDADVLLHWCYRLDGQSAHAAMIPVTPTPSQIAEMAARVGAKRLLPTHFRINMDSAEGHAGAISAMQTHFKGPSEIVEDLNIYVI